MHGVKVAVKSEVKYQAYRNVSGQGSRNFKDSKIFRGKMI